MTEAYIGQITLFAGTYAPADWMFCQGQVLQTTQYQALFSLLGNIYGGDGRMTFALPDLRGRVPLGTDPAQTATRPLGNKGGTEVIQPGEVPLPAHTHTATGKARAFKGAGDSDSPEGAVWAKTVSGETPYKKVAADCDMKTDTVQLAVDSASSDPTKTKPHLQPYLCLNYIICVQGLYPTRP